MSDKDVNEQPETIENTPGENGKKNLLFLYIAIGCFAAGCVLLGISFAVKGAGVYMLIASMISELAAVSFLNAQKRNGENLACKIIRILSYVVMVAAIIIVVIGMSVSSSAK